jgi:hypothetical protein
VQKKTDRELADERLETIDRRMFALEQAAKIYQGTGIGSYEEKTYSILTMAKEFEEYLQS